MRAGVESVLTFCSFHTVSVPLIRWCVVRVAEGSAVQQGLRLLRTLSCDPILSLGSLC